MHMFRIFREKYMYSLPCNKHFLKLTLILPMQVKLSSAQRMLMIDSVLIMSVSFQTNKARQLVGYLSPTVPPNCEISVSEQKLAFISGTFGDAVDSLTFYFN